MNYDNNYKQFEEFVDFDSFKIFYQSEIEIDYHITFFMAGLNAIITKWLNNGCIESPEEIDNLLKAEYNIKNRL